ncbi:MAG TPA: hypothetical protein PK299_03605 [Anaerolineales bacterium]|nr:hypothetical protein [Anaerolineales bacterium]
MVRLLNKLTDWLAKRRGLLTLVGIGLVVINFITKLIPGLEWFAQTDLFLHVGIVVGLLGLMLATALG